MSDGPASTSEHGTLVRRRENGIPLDDGNWKQLAVLASELRVRVPC